MTFASELKNLRASGLSTLGPSLKHAFDLLNLNRMTSGIDTYGQVETLSFPNNFSSYLNLLLKSNFFFQFKGRSPFYNESTIIIVITDGGHLTTTSGIQTEVSILNNDQFHCCYIFFQL